jgi:hypothetical protein
VFKDENDLLGVHKTYEFAIQQSKITAFKHEGRWVIRSGNPKDDGQVLWLVCQNYADTKREISKVAGRARPLPAALPAARLPRSPRCSPRRRQSSTRTSSPRHRQCSTQTSSQLRRRSSTPKAALERTSACVFLL